MKLRELCKVLLYTNIMIYILDRLSYNYYTDREEIPKELLDQEVTMVRGVSDKEYGACIEIHLRSI